MTPFENALSPRQRDVLFCLRSVLAPAGYPDPDILQMAITDHSLSEFSNYDGLTASILDRDMPEMKGTTVLDHYTSGGYSGIMRSQSLWLAPITLRLKQGELDTFAFEHGLKGYINSSGQMTPDLVQAAADLFYTSFTEPPVNQHLWTHFGANGYGYRLRFEVTPSGPLQVRAIRYHGGTTLLRQVNEALDNAGLPRFVLKVLISTEK